MWTTLTTYLVFFIDFNIHEIINWDNGRIDYQNIVPILEYLVKVLVQACIEEAWYIVSLALFNLYLFVVDLFT